MKFLNFFTSLRYKIILPLVLSAAILAALGMLTFEETLHELEEIFENDFSQNKIALLNKALELSGGSAQSMALMYSFSPFIQQALEEATQGNIDDPLDPTVQKARLMLRTNLTAQRESYRLAMGGENLRVHVHLPNNRSFLRVWRDKQIRRSGQFLDLSDDLTSFRQIVVDTNIHQKPLHGLELGRLGIFIRGIAPVFSDSGKHLGSVEVINNFFTLLKSITPGPSEDVAIYLLSDTPEFDKIFSNPLKYTTVGDNFEYLLVTASDEGKIEKAITKELLDASMQSPVIIDTEDAGMALAIHPVRNYSGKIVAIAAFGMDMEQAHANIAQATKYLVLVLLGALVCTGILQLVILKRLVFNPVRQLSENMEHLAHDEKINLAARLTVRGNDEMSVVATGFNELMKRIEDIVREQQVYLNMINLVPDPIFAVDENFSIIAANQATLQIAGESDIANIKGLHCQNIFETPACGTKDCPIARAAAGLPPSQKFNETEVLGNRVILQPVARNLRDIDGKIIGRMEVARVVTDLVEKEEALQKTLDITQNQATLLEEQKKELDIKVNELQELSRQLEVSNQRLDELSSKDELTGVANRRRFNEYFEREWRRAKREKFTIAVILMDIDHFKIYNDTYGHLKGDSCLRKTAHAMATILNRPSDMFARYGGEEFVAVLPTTDAQGAVYVAEAMRKALEGLAMEHKNSKTQPIVTASFGVAAMVPTQGVHAAVLTEQADQALYTAKEQGRNCVVTYTAPEVTK